MQSAVVITLAILYLSIGPGLSAPQWNIAQIARDAAIGAETGILAGQARGDNQAQLAQDAFIGADTGALIAERNGGGGGGGGGGGYGRGRQGR